MFSSIIKFYIKSLDENKRLVLDEKIKNPTARLNLVYSIN